MNIQLTFPIYSFKNSGIALEFISKYLNFGIEAIRPAGKDFQFWENRIIDEYKTSNPERFALVDELTTYHTEEHSIVFRREISREAEVFAGKISNKESIRLDALIRDAVHFNLSTAYLYDFGKAYWQSEAFIQNYETAKRPYEHLPIIEKPDLPPILARQIDVKKNPGHDALTFGMSLMAAPEMWFGPNSLNYFNKELLLSYPRAKRIVEVSPDLIYIHLFDWEEEDYESASILDLQRHFRSYTGMDGIEMKLDKFLADNEENM